MQWPAVSGLGDPRRPNGVYMEPQTGEAEFDTPREYIIPRDNPVQPEEESYYEGFDPQIAEAQRVYPIGGGKVFGKDPVAYYKSLIEAGKMKPEIYEKVPFKSRGAGGDWVETPTLREFYEKAGGRVLSDNDIVNNIIYGKYGNGDKRVQALTALGLTADDIERIRGLVNARMYAAQARPVKRRKPAAVPASNTPRQERTTYQGMPMNWVGPQDPDYIYVK
jgi:hypothetical protein